MKAAVVGAMVAKWRTAAVVVVLAGLVGCVAWQGPRTPNLVRTASEPAVNPPPVMWAILGWDETVRLDEASRREFALSLNRTMRCSPVLQSSWWTVGPTLDQATAPVHYVLFLDVSSDTTAQFWMALDVFFGMIFPAKSTESVKVTGSLYEAATGKELGAYEAKAALNRLAWLPLLPALPFVLAFGPTSDELYDSTFKDIFIQVATELQHRDLPATADPLQLQIKRTPAHQSRTIHAN